MSVRQPLRTVRRLPRHEPTLTASQADLAPRLRLSEAEPPATSHTGWFPAVFAGGAECPRGPSSPVAALAADLWRDTDQKAYRSIVSYRHGRSRAVLSVCGLHVDSSSPNGRVQGDDLRECLRPKGPPEPCAQVRSLPGDSEQASTIGLLTCTSATHEGLDPVSLSPGLCRLNRCSRVRRAGSTPTGRPPSLRAVGPAARGRRASPPSGFTACRPAGGPREQLRVRLDGVDRFSPAEDRRSTAASGPLRRRPPGASAHASGRRHRRAAWLDAFGCTSWAPCGSNAMQRPSSRCPCPV